MVSQKNINTQCKRLSKKRYTERKKFSVMTREELISKFGKKEMKFQEDLILQNYFGAENGGFYAIVEVPVKEFVVTDEESCFGYELQTSIQNKLLVLDLNTKRAFRDISYAGRDTFRVGSRKIYTCYKHGKLRKYSASIGGCYKKIDTVVDNKGFLNKEKTLINTLVREFEEECSASKILAKKIRALLENCQVFIGSIPLIKIPYEDYLKLSPCGEEVLGLRLMSFIEFYNSVDSFKFNFKGQYDRSNFRELSHLLS